MAGAEPVTVLGLGPMGQALAGAFLRAGHPTTVWNRTAAKADPLLAQGATGAETVSAAVAASRLVVASVIDYRVVREIVEQAEDAPRGRTLVNLASDTPGQARAAAAWAAERGIDYLDGAIMSPTVTIGTPSAVVLYSGPEALYTAHRASLASLGGTATYLGADPGRAAAYDMALLDLFWTAMSGLVHAFALAAEEGISGADLAPFARGIGDLLPDLVTMIGDEVDRGEHPGDISTLRSAAAGMDHVVAAAEGRGLDSSVLAAAVALARRAVASGHGDDGFSRLAGLLRIPATAR